MSEQNESPVSLEYLPCGCRNEIENEKVVRYDPCLACALSNAGRMLMAAGDRLHEAAQKEAEEEAARQEEIRRKADDFIGGSD